MSVDILYQDKRSAKGKFVQRGGHALFHSVRRIQNVNLRLYEKLARQDLTIRSALNTFENYIISTIGEVTHPDEEIASFLNHNLKTMEDTLGVSWKSAIKTALFTKDWAGYSVSEIIFKLEFGSLTLEDLITYHPSTLTIYTDKKGRLVEGGETLDGYHKSGIYQVSLDSTTSLKKLDLWKVLYLGADTEYGNYYGQSLVAPCYKWQRLKEALIDLMLIYLERAGHRMTWISSIAHPTDQSRIDPSTGDERTITTLDLLREQIEKDDDLKQTLLLPYNVEGSSPEIGSVPLSDLVGNMFLDAIAYADQESVKHIIPYFLISDGGHSLSASSIERRMEVFYTNKEQAFNSLTTEAIKQVLQPLVKWNFNRESAKIAPSFARIHSDRSEDRVASMQTVKGLTENGYLNPTNSVDWRMVRQMLRLSDRMMTKEDQEWIEEIVINPRQKGGSSESKGGPNGAGKPGRQTGSTTKHINSRVSVPKNESTEV